MTVFRLEGFPGLDQGVLQHLQDGDEPEFPDNLGEDLPEIDGPWEATNSTTLSSETAYHTVNDPEQEILDGIEQSQYHLQDLNRILDRTLGQNGERLPRRKARRTVFGYYTKEDRHGVGNLTIHYKDILRYLNGYVSSKCPGAKWTSLEFAIDHNNDDGPPHQTLQGTHLWRKFLDGGEFWTDEPDAEGIHEKVWYDDDGDQVEGRLLPANGVVAKVKHGFRYASREWIGGRRWTITCFTARSFPESSAKEKAGLRDCGFPVPDLRHLCKGREDQNDNGNKVREFTGHLPKHSIRKELWKTAAGLSTFLTWSVIALTTGIGESHDEPRHVSRDQLPLLELGGWTETVEAAEILNDSYIHEPILWAGPGEPDVRTSLAEVLKEKDPGVLWIHWPGARHAQDVGFFEILRDFVPIQLGRD